MMVKILKQIKSIETVMIYFGKYITAVSDPIYNKV
jgi:hypothetical protein